LSQVSDVFISEFDPESSTLKRCDAGSHDDCDSGSQLHGGIEEEVQTTANFKFEQTWNGEADNREPSVGRSRIPLQCPIYWP
jgi:hypothetical protein